MLKRLLKKRSRRSRSEAEVVRTVIEDGSLIHLKGRTIERSVKTEIGASILELAEKYDVDWNSNCRRGTCARCRCFVEEGSVYLSEPNEAEVVRLEQSEINEGYRLGCQAKIEQPGDVKVRHASYF